MFEHMWSEMTDLADFIGLKSFDSFTVDKKEVTFRLDTGFIASVPLSRVGDPTMKEYIALVSAMEDVESDLEDLWSDNLTAPLDHRSLLLLSAQHESAERSDFMNTLRASESVIGYTGKEEPWLQSVLSTEVTCVSPPYARTDFLEFWVAKCRQLVPDWCSIRLNHPVGLEITVTSDCTACLSTSGVYVASRKNIETLVEDFPIIDEPNRGGWELTVERV